MMNIFSYFCRNKSTSNYHQGNYSDLACGESQVGEKFNTQMERIKGFEKLLQERYHQVAQDLMHLDDLKGSNSYLEQSMLASFQSSMDNDIKAFFETIQNQCVDPNISNPASVLLQQLLEEQQLDSKQAKLIQIDQQPAGIELSSAQEDNFEIAQRAKRRHEELDQIKSELFHSCLNFIAQDHAEQTNSRGKISLIDRVEAQKFKLAVYEYIQFVKLTFHLSSFNETQLINLKSYYAQLKGGDEKSQQQIPFIESFRQLRRLLFNDIELYSRNPSQVKVFQESLTTMLQSNHKLADCILLFLVQAIQLTSVSDEFIEAGSNAFEILINVGFDFSGFDLSNCKISNISIAGGNFTFASLASSQFENVDISGCNFSNANLSNINWVNIKSNEQAQLSIPYGEVKRLAYTFDGKYLVSGGSNNQIQLWNKKTGFLEHSLKGHQNEIRAICVSKLNDLIATGGRDCTVRLWDIGEKKLIATLGTHKDCVNAVQFFDEHAQRKLISVAYDGKIMFWDIHNFKNCPEAIKCIDGHPNPINCIGVLQEKQIMATGSRDSQIKVWDLLKLDLTKTLAGHTGQVTSIVFAFQHSLLISGSQDSTIRLWKLENLNEFEKLTGHSAPVLSLALCRSGQILASGGKENTVRLWCLKSLQLVGVFCGSVGSVESLSFDPSGDLLALSGQASFIQIIDSAQLIRNQNHAWHSDYVTSVAYSPNGKLVASGSYDNTVRIWELSINSFVQRAKLFKILADHSDHIEAVAFSAGGQYLASGSWDHTIRIWKTSTWMCWKVLKEQSDVLCVAFSNDEKLLYSGYRDGRMQIWDLQSVKQMCKSITYSQAIKVVAPSPELATQKNSFVVSGGMEKKINFWNLQKNQNDEEKSNQIGSFDTVIQTLVFSKFENKEYLICCDDKSSIWVHDMKSLPIHRSQLDGHLDAVTSLAISPRNGKYLISGSFDRTIRIWDMSKLAQIRVFLGHEDVVTSVSFSPDGNYIVSGSRDKTLRFWEFTTTQEAAQKQISNQSALYLLAHSQESHLLALTDKENAIRIFSTSTNQEVTTLWKHTNLVTGIRFFCEGEYLASSSLDCTIVVWKKEQNDHYTVFQTLEHQSPVTSFALWQFTLVSCCKAKQNFKIWRSAKRGFYFKQENQFGHDIQVRQVRFSPDGSLIVSSGAHKKLLIKHLRENKVQTYQMVADVGSLEFLKIHDEVYLALEMPTTVGIWSFKTKQIEIEIPSHQMKVIGNVLVTLQESRELQVWDCEKIPEFSRKAQTILNIPIMTFVVGKVDNSEDLYYYITTFSGQVYLYKEQLIELPRKRNSETNYDEKRAEQQDFQVETTMSFLDKYYRDTLGTESREKRQQIEMMQIRQNDVAVNNTFFCQSKIISNQGYQLTDYYKNYTIFKK